MAFEEQSEWLDRVREAQQSGSHGSHFSTALDEIRSGKKSSDWVWYVFPQIEGLGRSAMNQRFAVSNVDDGRRFLDDPTTGSNFQTVLEVALEHLESGASLVQLMNGDERKFVSSITLMRWLSISPEVVELTQRALAASSAQGYMPCQATLRWLDERGVPHDDE